MLDWLMLLFAKNIAWKKNPDHHVTHHITKIPYTCSDILPLVRFLKVGTFLSALL